MIRDFAVFIPIVAIIATAWVIVTVLRMRHRPGDAESDEEQARLADENEALRVTAGRLEERIAVLERIATDPAERTAREIEKLR